MLLLSYKRKKKCCSLTAILTLLVLKRNDSIYKWNCVCTFLFKDANYGHYSYCELFRHFSLTFTKHVVFKLWTTCKIKETFCTV